MYNYRFFSRTYYVILTKVVIHPMPIIYFWVIMWTEAKNQWKLFVCFLLTKSNIQKISSYWEEIMNVRVLIGKNTVKSILFKKILEKLFDPTFFLQKLPRYFSLKHQGNFCKKVGSNGFSRIFLKRMDFNELNLSPRLCDFNLTWQF